MSTRAWAVVPAAGRGRRMAGAVPKQYLVLAGKPILQHTVERLVGHPRVRGVVVVLAAGDAHWDGLDLAARERVITVTGGDERCHSVLAALTHLAALAEGSDWVMVHDAARPCVRADDIDALVTAAGAHAVGGLLAVPVRDTMKRAGPGDEIVQTVDRHGLWHAQTPQMFRLAELRSAIEAALAAGVTVTDEAQALELRGRMPLLVAGHADNIKVTEPQDAALAELFLRRQDEAGTCA